jgi:hypothetical protein
MHEGRKEGEITLSSQLPGTAEASEMTRGQVVAESRQRPSSWERCLGVEILYAPETQSDCSLRMPLGGPWLFCLPVCQPSLQTPSGPGRAFEGSAQPSRTVLPSHIHNQSVLPPRAAGTRGVVECQGLFVLFWLAPTWQELIFLLMTSCCETQLPREGLGSEERE